MHLRLCQHLLPWVLLACSSRPDSALFDEPIPNGTNHGGTKGAVAGGGSTSETSPGGAGTETSGGTMAAGGRPSGGAPPVGGTASEAGAGGVDDPEGMAGAGSGPGTPEPPVC